MSTLEGLASVQRTMIMDDKDLLTKIAQTRQLAEMYVAEMYESQQGVDDRYDEGYAAGMYKAIEMIDVMILGFEE